LLEILITKTTNHRLANEHIPYQRLEVLFSMKH